MADGSDAAEPGGSGNLLIHPNGCLVGVSEAARILGVPRRTVAGRLTSGAWPTATSTDQHGHKRAP